MKKKSVKKKKKSKKKSIAKVNSKEELRDLVKEHEIKNKPKRKIIRKKITPVKLSPKREKEIAEDFAIKAYQKFNKIIKSIILFGSQVKSNSISSSDIDIIIVLDDASVKWDETLVTWYRTELEKLVRENKYEWDLHISTIRLTTWWEDLMRGDPTILNVIRYGEELIDFGGFFRPLRLLLLNGKIRPSSEAIVSCIQRAPMHIARSKNAKLNAIEGVFWAMVDTSHAGLLTLNVLPPSPEHISLYLNKYFVSKGELKRKYIAWYNEVYDLHKKITRGDVTYIKGVEIDSLEEKANEYFNVMSKIINKKISLRER